jgi:hypothetical protein
MSHPWDIQTTLDENKSRYNSMNKRKVQKKPQFRKNNRQPQRQQVNYEQTPILPETPEINVEIKEKEVVEEFPELPTKAQSSPSNGMDWSALFKDSL